MNLIDCNDASEIPKLEAECSYIFRHEFNEVEEQKMTIQDYRVLLSEFHLNEIPKP